VRIKNVRDFAYRLTRLPLPPSGPPHARSRQSESVNQSDESLKHLLYSLTRLLAFALVAIVFAACASSKPAGDDTAKDQAKDEEEMVEVGYGKQRKGDVTGLVATVDVEQVKRQQPVARVSDLLRGRVSGVVANEAPAAASPSASGAPARSTATATLST
jgi:hypothetical protein